MGVGGIVMTKKGPNLDTVMTILSDGVPVAGVIPQVSLCSDNGSCYFEATELATDSKGKTKYKLLKPSGGWYTMTVIDVSPGATSFTFDGNVTFERYKFP